VDVVFGTHNVGSLPVLLERARVEEESQIEILEALEHSLPPCPPVVYQHFLHGLQFQLAAITHALFADVPALRGIEKDRNEADILSAG
jgi:tRNA-2-methylthio-N6-dimethylallyladenosine synthase